MLEATELLAGSDYERFVGRDEDPPVALGRSKASHAERAVAAARLAEQLDVAEVATIDRRHVSIVRPATSSVPEGGP